jgi:uncharacterized repeat protein (TIGR01451 family)
MHNRGPVWFGITLVVIVAAIGAWIYFIQPSASLDVAINLAATPANLFLGDPFDISVALANDSHSAMQTSSVSLILPNGIISADSPDQRVVTKSIGTLDPAGVSNQTFHLIATGPASTVFHVTARVTYRVNGSSAQFENTQGVDLPVGQSAVAASVSLPNTSVYSGQVFPITVTYVNATDHPVNNFSIAMQYPPAFTFSNATASASLATSGNNAWNLGTLPPQATGTIVVNGSLAGSGDTSYPFGAVVAMSSGDRNYPIANPQGSLSLASSPLTFELSLNNAQSYVSHADDSLSYTLHFTNNSTVAFQNVVITAKLAGTMYDFSTLQTSGSFNSVTDVIMWNGAAEPQLLSLAPGQSGSVDFYVRTKQAFPIRLLSDKNYSVSVDARLSSPTVPPGTAASSTLSIAHLTTELGGQIVLAAKAYHKEPAASGIKNSGPYPPKVNQATQYTIHWLLTNYATDADNVTIRAFLQSGSTCTGPIATPASTTLVCDPASGQVTWQIPIVPATTGITGKPLEAVFQITNTPAVNQIGQDVTLIGQATLSATDGFTSSTMQSSVGSMTTALPDDASVPTNGRKVSP